LLLQWQEAGISYADLDAVAATSGPGLIGGVLVGMMTGKAIAQAAGKPFLAVNHLEGHALSPRDSPMIAPSPTCSCCSCPAATASFWKCAVWEIMAGSVRPLMTPLAKPSTRRRNCWD
jgi:hypothetical protein